MLADLVKKHRAGFVSSVRDSEGLASAVLELLTNDSLWTELSVNAIKLASLFDVEKLAQIEAKIIAKGCM